MTPTDPLQSHLQRLGLCGAIIPDRQMGCAWPPGHVPSHIHGWGTEGRMGDGVRQTIESVEELAAAPPISAEST